MSEKNSLHDMKISRKENGEILMKSSDQKQFLLKCWIKLALFLQWVEKHPLIDRMILLVVKVVIYILTLEKKM